MTPFVAISAGVSLYLAASFSGSACHSGGLRAGAAAGVAGWPKTILLAGTLISSSLPSHSILWPAFSDSTYWVRVRIRVRVRVRVRVRARVRIRVRVRVRVDL